MRNSSAEDSGEGGANSYRQGVLFEEEVLARLGSSGGPVSRGQGIRGRSGVLWRCDFLVGEKLVIEASTQKRLDTKLAETFVKFADISRAYPKLKYALLLRQLHVGYHRSQRKSFFPTSMLRVMLDNGFAVITLDQVPNLQGFVNGNLTASEISPLPSDYNPRSLTRERERFEVLSFIKSVGWVTRRGLVAGVPHRSVGGLYGDLEALFREGRLVRVGSYYGVDRDVVTRAVMERGSGTSKQRAEVRKWLAQKMSEYAASNQGLLRTADFCRKQGISATGITRLIHDLREAGTIRYVSKGVYRVAV